MTVRILRGDARDVLLSLPDASVHCVVTSPPYFGLRDYGLPPTAWPEIAFAPMPGMDAITVPATSCCLGLEDTPAAYVAHLVFLFREVRRVLRDDGTCWINIGDSYAGSGRGGNPTEESSTLQGGQSSQKAAIIGRKMKRGSLLPVGKHETVGESGSIGRAWVLPPVSLKPKDLMGIPWRLAFALQAAGWYLRQDIIWHKPNPMPESIKDRCTKAHEYLFLLTKSEQYQYDADAIAEPCESNESDKKKMREGKPRIGGKHKDLVDPLSMASSTTNIGKKRSVGNGDTRNKRSVWTIATAPYTGAHFATFPPALIEDCILSGCPPAGKRCDCLELIRTPTGTGGDEDPSLEVGRAGMARTRGENEGTRPITRHEQRWHAEEMKVSPHRAEMESAAGATAFAHYIRTDRSGARPLPEHLRTQFLANGWISAPPADCGHHVEPAGTVLDPFFGAGTTGLVADRLQRNCIGIELNSAYAEMARKRIHSDAPLFSECE